MPTPHNNAQKGDYAKIVLMPGDPKRATWVAETYLHDVKLVNEVRGALAYTGYTKNGYKISVMASGMGQPSIQIYSHELYNFYDVDCIIRIGTMGGYTADIQPRDVVIAQGASTDGANHLVQGILSGLSDFDVTAALVKATREKGLPCHVGNILSSNTFYNRDPDAWKTWARCNILGVEMESYGLFVNAALAHKKAGCICTVSDHLLNPEVLTPEERQTGLVNMVEIAIKACETLIDQFGYDK